MFEGIQKTLLLVEDEVLIAMTEKKQLEQYGYAVKTVISGEKAIETIKTLSDIDLILMDINLGDGIDGTQVAEIILKDHDIPIVFVSSYSEREVVEKTEKITSYGYVVKNSSVTVLDASIKMAFKLFDAKIRELKKEEELKKSEDRLSKIQLAENDGMWDWDLSTNEVYFDPRYYQMSGYEIDEFPHNFEEFKKRAHPDDYEKVMDIVKKHIAGIVERYDVNFRFLKKSGQWQWIQGKGVIVEWDENGNPLRFIGTHRDITELKKIEEALRESENNLRESEVKYSKIFNESPYPVMIISTDNGCFTDLNEAMAKSVEYSKQELIGKSAVELGIVSPEIELQTRRLIAENGQYSDIEVSIKTKTGKVRFGMATGRIVELNKHPYLLQTIVDITERKKSEEALRESEERFDLAVDASNEGLFDWNLETNEIYYSPRWKSILGYEEHEIPNDFSVWETTTEPEDVKRSWELQQKLITGQIDRFAMEFKMKHKHGHWVYILSQAKAVFDKNGKAIRIVGTHTDITDRKSTEKALRASKQKTELLLNVAAEIIISLDSKGDITLLNESGHRILEYVSPELVGKNWFDTCLPIEERREIGKFFGLLLEGESTFLVTHESNVVTKNGKHRTILWHNFLLKDEEGKGIGLFSSGEDITERKQAEEALRKSEHLIKSIIQSTQDIVAFKDTNFIFRLANPAMCKMSGKSENEIIGKTDSDIFFHELAEKYRNDDIYVIESGQSINIEEEILSYGSNRYMSTTKAPVLNEKNKCEGVVIIVRDITERKRAEESLRNSAKRLEGIIEGTHVGTWEWNVQTGETTFNSIWAEMIGYTLEELSPISIQTWIKNAHPDDLADSEEKLNQHFLGNTPFYELECRIRHKEGHWVWVLDKGKVITWSEDGKPLMMFGTHTDITEQKRISEKVKALLSEKVLLLKEVHHRIKNNMNTVGSLLSLQASKINEPVAKLALDDAKNRIQSMMLLYDKLYRSQDYTEFSIKNYLTSLIDEVVANFPNCQMVKIKKNIQDFNLDVKRLQPLGIMMNELLTNIMKYAFAGKDRGTILVSVTSNDGRIMVSVQDDGIGIPQSLSFENSTGFGLQLVYAITQQLNGTIRIERDNGTKIIFEFDD